MKKNKESKDDRQLGHSLNLLAKSSVVVLMGLFLSKLFTYLYRIMIAREFGPEVYGLFSLGLMALGLFITFSDFGITHGVLRYTSMFRGRNEVKKIKYLLNFSRTSLAVPSFLLGVIMFFSADYVAITFFKNSDLTIFLKVFSFLIPITVYSYLYLSVIRAFEKISWYSFIFNIAQNGVKIVVLGLLILIGAKSIAVPVSYALGTVAMFFLAYFVCKMTIPHVFGRSNLSKSEKSVIKREVLHYSLPLLFFSAVSIIFYWIDTFSIGYFKSATEVGLYNTAIPLAMMFSLVPELFMQLFFPLVNKEYGRKNMVLIRELSKQIVKWIFMVNLPVFVLIIFFPGAAINVLFGAEYLSASTALRILAIGGLTSSIFVVSNQLISAMGKTKTILLNIVIASVINITLNWILIPMKQIWFIENSSGINGAAIATVISILVLNALLFVQSYRFVKLIPFRRKMITITAVAGISALVLFYVKGLVGDSIYWIIPLICLFFVVYFALIIITKSLDRNDLAVIKSAIVKIKSTYFNSQNS